MRAEVSLEGLSTFAPDPIFMQKNRALTVEQAMKSIEASTVWSGMKAVKNRQLYLFDNLLAMSWGPNGRSLILEYTLEALTQSKNR
jgi:ABC-type Fe3+-hydroxamate transport system substrate-binding protein